MDSARRDVACYVQRFFFLRVGLACLTPSRTCSPEFASEEVGQALCLCVGGGSLLF